MNKEQNLCAKISQKLRSIQKLIGQLLLTFKSPIIKLKRIKKEKITSKVIIAIKTSKKKEYQLKQLLLKQRRERLRKKKSKITITKSP